MGGGGEERKKGFFSSCRRFSIRYCGGKEAKWLGYGGPGNKPSTLPLTGLFLNGSLSSTPWLYFVRKLRPASCPLGFLHPVFIYNVWDQIVRIYLEMSPVGRDWSILRVCPREHQAIELYAISSITMKLCQFKWSTPRQTDFCFGFFQGEIDHPPHTGFLSFHQGNRFKIGKVYEALIAMVSN